MGQREYLQTNYLLGIYSSNIANGGEPSSPSILGKKLSAYTKTQEYSNTKTQQETPILVYSINHLVVPYFLFAIFHV
jgi:hypothetical protein